MDEVVKLVCIAFMALAYIVAFLFVKPAKTGGNRSCLPEGIVAIITAYITVVGFYEGNSLMSFLIIMCVGICLLYGYVIRKG
jgi:hypothetical protein